MNSFDFIVYLFAQRLIKMTTHAESVKAHCAFEINKNQEAKKK